MSLRSVSTQPSNCNFLLGDPFNLPEVSLLPFSIQQSNLENGNLVEKVTNLLDDGRYIHFRQKEVKQMGSEEPRTFMASTVNPERATSDSEQGKKDFLNLLHLVSVATDMLILEAAGKKDELLLYAELLSKSDPHDVISTAPTSYILAKNLKLSEVVTVWKDDLRKIISLAKKIHQENRFQEEVNIILELWKIMSPEMLSHVKRHVDFIKFCFSGELEKARKLFEEGKKAGFFDVNKCMVFYQNKKNRYFTRPLFNNACVNGNTNLVDFLLELRADVNQFNTNGGPFSNRWDPAIVETATSEPPKSATPLEKETFFNKQDEILNKLKKAKADVNLNYGISWTIRNFFDIPETENVLDRQPISAKAVYNLMKCGWNIEASDSWFFWKETRYKCIEVAKQFIYCGFNIERDRVKDVVLLGADTRRDTIITAMCTHYESGLHGELADALPRLSLDLVRMVAGFIKIPLSTVDLSPEFRILLADKCNEAESKAKREAAAEKR